ncbi:unnamed protein product [Adineta ricciae]|uniref:Hermes trasposase DNA-binding domain-containing protein n=1 Tax=Adineta ricciae TaxID=249248 RepID=A0A816BFE3_ADIRI|nr:unnamed protein product [Adineta ricciae]
MRRSLIFSSLHSTQPRPLPSQDLTMSTTKKRPAAGYREPKRDIAIACTKCYRTSIYGSKSVTKRFIDHANRCSPLLSQSIPHHRNLEELQATLDNIVIKKKAHITAKEQNEIKHLYAKWICEDFRPFTIVEDNGFQQLAQTFIRLGSQYGCIDVKEVVRSRQSVARTVDDLAQKHRTILKSELREPLKAQAITIAPDFWTSKYNQQAFLGLNITYVTADHKFKSVNLFCIPFNGKKSYDLIRESNLNQEIKAAGGTTLHQSCVVPWLSLSDLLQSVIKSFKATKKVLSSNKKQELIDGLNDQYLKQLLILLSPFKHVMTLIQCGN